MANNDEKKVFTPWLTAMEKSPSPMAFYHFIFFDFPYYETKYFILR